MIARHLSPEAARLHKAALKQLSQTRFNENSMGRALDVRKKRAKRKYLHSASAASQNSRWHTAIDFA
jgi:hypothetical protein